MALLPQDPRQQSSLLIIVVAICVGWLFYQFLYLPRSATLTVEEARLTALDDQNRLAEARIGNLQQLRDDLRFAERQFAALQRLVPSRSEVPAIYESIARATQSLNLQLIRVAPAVPVADSGAYFLRQNWEMQVQGEYHFVGRLLAQVASLDRIVRPQVEEIRPTDETPSGRQLVQATLDLETYVLPPGTPGEPEPNEP